MFFFACNMDPSGVKDFVFTPVIGRCLNRHINVPVVIVHSERDEFIKREHAEYLARSIPNAKFVLLHGVSHFAPLQRPDQFNAAMLEFLD